jgi:AcrR family transcriptional regulator
MNKTDPRVIKTLHSIDEALLDNLKNHDFRKITVDTLCRSARINRSTFYEYYSDKYDLLDNFLNRILSEFSEATISTGFILASPYYNTNEKFIQDFEKMIEFIYGRLEIYRILWTASIDRSIYTEMESIIRQNVNKILQSELSTPPDGKTACYHDLYARLLASNFLTLVRWWVTNQPSISRSDVVSVMEGSIRKSLLLTLPFAKDA